MNELGHLPTREPQDLSSYFPEKDGTFANRRQQVYELYEQILTDQNIDQNPQAPVTVSMCVGNLEMEIKPLISNQGKDSAVVEFNVTFRKGEGEEDIIFKVCNEERHDLLRLYETTDNLLPDNVSRIDGRSLEVTDLVPMNAISREMVEFDEKLRIFQEVQQPRDTNNVIPLTGKARPQ
ncbi:MAG: hypothetical protein AAB914_00395 [Patescibacteria group bacterium]